MNGDEHYREAEAMLIRFDDGGGEDDLVIAQVHATLALAAAMRDQATPPHTIVKFTGDVDARTAEKVKRALADAMKTAPSSITQT